MRYGKGLLIVFMILSVFNVLDKTYVVVRIGYALKASKYNHLIIMAILMITGV